MLDVLRGLARRLMDADPLRTSRAIALGRCAIGVIGLLVPQALARATTDGALSPATRIGFRMAGARDLALGLGVLLAARRRPESLRGWVEAGAMSDAADAVIYVVDGAGFTPPARVASVGVAAGAAGIGMVAARRLSENPVERLTRRARRRLAALAA